MSLIGWWKLDGNAYDSSPARDNGIVTGVTYDPSYGIIGQGGNFTSGGNTYIDITQINITTHHTLCFWMYSNESEPSGPGAFLMGEFNSAVNYIAVFDSCYFMYSDGSGGYDWSGDTDFYHRWRHVAMLFDTSTVELFLDGITQGTKSYDGTFTLNNFGTGYLSSEPDLDYNGYLNDIRVYDHILSVREIKEISRCKIFHARCDYNTFDSATDYSVIKPTIINSPGSSLYNTINYRTGIGCIDFSNTTTTYIDYGNPNVLKFNTNCTICFRINLNSLPAVFAFVIAKAFSGEGSIGVISTGAVALYWGTAGDNGNPDSYSYSSVGAITTESWISIAVVRHEQDEICHWYKNGQFLNSNITTWGAAISGDRNFYLGYEADLTDYPTLDGLLDDIRIYNSALSADDILEIHQTSAQLDNKGNLWC